jgi:hypothetical protein
VSKLDEICPKVVISQGNLIFMLAELLSYHQSNVEGINFLKILTSKPWPGLLALAFRT